MTYAPGTTYAAVILKTIRDIRGDAPLPDSDFKDWVEGKLAIPEMEPLRDWIEAEPDLFIGNLAAATVFTTGTPLRAARR